MSKHAVPEYPKEKARLRDVEERLERACHLTSAT